MKWMCCKGTSGGAHVINKVKVGSQRSCVEDRSNSSRLQQQSALDLFVYAHFMWMSSNTNRLFLSKGHSMKRNKRLLNNCLAFCEKSKRQDGFDGVDYRLPGIEQRCIEL